MGYFLGRGKIFIADRDATTGQPGEFIQYHCPEVEAEMQTEYADHYNSNDRVKALDLHIITQQEGQLRIVLDEFEADALGMALGGEVTDVATGATFTDVAFPAGVVAGKKYSVPGGYVNLDTLTIEDSAGTPVALALNTNYTVDLASGIVTFVDITGFTQPFTATGAEADAFEVVSMQTRGVVEKYIRFDGINVAVEPNKPLISDFYRVSIGPNKIALKNEGNEVNKFEFNGMMLRDETAPFDSTFGKYGRVVKV